MECKHPIVIIERISMIGKRVRALRNVYAYCEYLKATTEECNCPYDNCIMNPKISLKENMR